MSWAIVKNNQVIEILNGAKAVNNTLALFLICGQKLI